MLVSSSVAAQVAAAQEGLSYIRLVIFTHACLLLAPNGNEAE
jgi:hypothetical protein